MKYWLFQANPKYYRLGDAIRDSEQMPWLVTRYVNEMTVGDGVLIWQAGEKAGIYATAEIIEQPKMVDKQPDIDYWLDKSRLGSKPQATIRFTKKLLDAPLLRENLKQDPILKSLSVIRQPNATNYKVTPQEWQQIHEIINSAI
ncbi:EVE domain-containing protein [Ancylothrix sp. C2]|uniref:EVE domain-containing protein n=1 Tax=Ancylothrix sp. D3o TaxID=2953691 RepID=UPI0021BABC5F|nr:EVE domain-containing protein [Ancylothrix sp. D3o]MCT7953084.1 EVE domain-containing protein [Ancylothrix sp. D3o]